MRRLVLATALLLPQAAMAAEWWQGIWAEDLAWCAQADHIGYVLPAPIAITASETLGYENECVITFAGELADVNAVHLTLACEGEGEHYEEDRLVMKGGDDAIWIWFGSDEPVKYQRCR